MSVLKLPAANKGQNTSRTQCKEWWWQVDSDGRRMKDGEENEEKGAATQADVGVALRGFVGWEWE